MSDILNENEQLKKDLEDLKTKVNLLLEKNKIGEEVGDQIRKQVDQYKALREKGIKIRFLEDKFGNDLYQKTSAITQGRIKVITETMIKEAIEKTDSALMAAKFIGVSYPTYKKYAQSYGLHTTKGFVKDNNGIGRKKRGLTNPFKGKYPIGEILENKFPGFPVHRLKDKLIRAGIKEAKCEQCGYGERRITDGKLPLLINFEDGDCKNFKLENLKLLCYNCTFTSGKGYISRGPKTFDPDTLQDSKKILNTRF